MTKFWNWLTQPPEGEEVVISGISGRLPESNNVREFCYNLLNKVDMVTEDDRRWSVNIAEVPKRSSKINDIDKFDGGFFGIHYRQAETMDPMARLFLEVAVESIMDAGVNPAELKGSKTGVFVGACASEAEIMCNVSLEEFFTATGILRSFISNRISYHLQLKGPSIIVDTACSSSMNALEHALKSIRSGQCDNALVGGVNLVLHPANTMHFFRLGVLSKDGTCKVFDQDADGYVRAESATCIFLQKSSNAKRIYATILNAKVNCDGFKEQGITFPSTEMQSQLIEEVFKEGAFNPTEVEFLEAHGTGTQIGDPQEVDAIDRALAQYRSTPLLIGSVKCSIGHSEPASGLCSIIKVIIAMETGVVPPNIHLKNYKKGIRGFEEGRLKVVTEPTKLQADDALIGINNFGFGGNNCHVLLRRFGKTKKERGLLDGDRLVCVSGRTIESVLCLTEDVSRPPHDEEYIGLLHQLFKNDIQHHLYRGFVIIKKNGCVRSSPKKLSHNRRNCHVFFGNFEREHKMFAQFFLRFPCFRTAIQKINRYLVAKHHIDVLELIEGKLETVYDTVSCFAVQISFLEVLKALELQPTAVYGESLGKLSCAYHYGIVTMEEAVDKLFEVITSSVEKTRNAWSNRLNHYISEVGKIFHHIVFNLSDEALTGNDEEMRLGNNTNNFLEIIGRLYEEGYNPQIYRLYPPVEYPVSRGTAMISPSIKWRHTKSWYTFKFNEFEITSQEQQKFNFSLDLSDEHKYILGHIIDGRSLFPATEYINIVWKTFVQSRRLLPEDVPVIFENCKFLKAVTIPQNGSLTLLVSIQKHSGNFEVIDHNDSVVVTGRVYTPKEVGRDQLKLAEITENLDDPLDVIEEDEIYRELYLRNYNYSGPFKGIVKCNSEATFGLIRWENNWSTFVDKMLQMRIIQYDTRLLYVPTGIRKISINPTEHLKFVEKQQESRCPVHVYKHCNIIKSGGIEIRGLTASSIGKRTLMAEPILEKYVFLPNDGCFAIDHSLRILTQIVLENSLENNFKAVEILDDSNNAAGSTLVLPLIRRVLDDLPMVNPDLTVSTKNNLEACDGVKVENFILTSTSNLLLVVTSNLLQHSSIPLQILNALTDNGFILSRERKNPTRKSYDEIEILNEHRLEGETLILFRKRTNLGVDTFIEVKSDNYEWLNRLQAALKRGDNIVIFARNEEPEGIVGFLNCIRREPKGDKVRCFFMMDDAPQFDPEDPFYAGQIKKNCAVNIYKNGRWGTYRHLLLEQVSEVESVHCFVNTIKRGDLSSLRWFAGHLDKHTKHGANQVILYPYYVALNFKDVMTASGRVNVDAISNDRLYQENLLGFEVSGRDASGRRVMAMGNVGISTMAVVRKESLVEIPDHWSLEEAATLFVVYSTAIYAFKVGSIRPGSSVLIHSATGGVGLAAINVCLYHNCEIFVTVGTMEKREFIRKHFPQIDDGHISNSRDSSQFEEMIKVQTGGRGVDYVLNSLSEEKLRASLRCLGTGGCFLEIGKFDIGTDAQLSLLLTERNISFHGIMLDRVHEEHRMHEMRTLFVEGIDKGIVKPLPRKIFEKGQVEDAFRYMASGKHIGKVLLEIRKEDESILPPSEIVWKGLPRFHCKSEKSYIIVGGLGGFGLELADWLFLRGAKNLILVSRFGTRSGYHQMRIRNWTTYGVNVKVSTADVTTEEGCRRLINEADELGTVDGIFNLAAILQDGIFENQTEEMFGASLAPKAQATKFLDGVSRRLCPDLRFFVVFSSVSCGRGNPGQTNYGMANSIMERICERRKSDGFPALAIQWGAIGNVGLVAKMQKENKELVIGGTLQQKISSCLDVLDKFLSAQDNTIVASMVVAEKNSRSADNVVDAVANILGIKDIKSVGFYKTLAELGMDSITTGEIINVLEKEYDIFIPPKDIRSLTFAKLKEIEAEKRNSDVGESTQKIAEGTEFLLKYIPLPEQHLSRIINLPSKIADDETAPIVLFFPGIEGVFHPLEPLSESLKARAFGINYSYYSPEDSIGELAQNILPHVEALLSNNTNFNIIAYSFGSLVATEVVSALENKGYIGNFFAIDGSHAYIQSAIDKHIPAETDAEFETILLDQILKIVLPIDVVRANTAKILKLDNFEERINFAKSIVDVDTATKQELDSQAAFTLLKRFKSAEYAVVDDIPDDYCLSELCHTPVNVVVVSGDHSSILNNGDLYKGIGEQL